MYQYTITNKTKDPTNGNIVVAVDFQDNTNPDIIYSQKTWGFDLTNISIDNWARSIIETLVVRDTNFDGITIGIATTPSPIDTSVQEAQDALIVLDTAIAQANLKKTISDLNDPDVNTAYANLAKIQPVPILKLQV